MDLEELDLKHIWHPCSQMKDYEELPPIIIDHAAGMYLYDIYGKRYLDIVSSWWCNLLGHCHPRINAAIKNQIDKLEHVIFANFSHVPAITLCDMLTAVLPAGLTKFSFTDNGSSAVEAAMKMSFQYHYQTGSRQKRRFMSLTDAYHGETVGALSAGGVDLYAKIFEPMLLDMIHVDGPDCYRCSYGKDRETCRAECFAAAEKSFAQFGSETCAFLVEPLVQGAAGMKMYPPIYLKKLRAACDQYQVLLLDDEIAMGFGRTGWMFACQHADIVPDIMCLSKGLTGGYLPMALVVTNQSIYDAFYDDYGTHKAFVHSHTYSGNPLACAAAVEVLKILREDHILDTAKQNAPYFSRLVNDTLKNCNYVGDIRSIGLINAVELVADKQNKQPFDPKLRIGYQIYKKALEKGVVLRPIGDVLYFNPPLNICRTDMEFAVKVCAECIKEILA